MDSSHENNNELLEESSNIKNTIGRPKTSWIWEFFDLELRNGERWAICKLNTMGTNIPCKKEYKTGGSTKNCSDHLLNKHELLPNGQAPQQKNKNIKKHKESRQCELRQFLVNFILDTGQSLRIVERESFRQLIQELDPAFNIPDSKSIKAIIHVAYNYTFETLVKLLQPITSVSLTLDFWTARSHHGYLGITCSYLDQQYNIHEITLTLSYVRYPHTSEHIKESIEEVLDSWNLRSKVHSITTDNGSNVKKCVKNMKGIEWYPCVSHTLQLVIGKGLLAVKKLILRVKRLIIFFSRPKQAERLEDVQKSINENQLENEEVKKTDKYLRTIQDCVTRWNSSYLAWQRLLLLRDAISILNTKLARETDSDSKKDSKQLKNIMITTQEWDLIQNLVDVLEPFAEATDYLSDSSYCTHSIINPLIEQIKKELKPPSQSSSSSRSTTTTTAPDEDVFDEEDLELDQDQDDELNQPINTHGLLEIVKKKLYENLCQYWNFQDPQTLLSTLLDPRTKCLKDVSVRIQLETEELLRDKVEELKLRETTHDSPSSSPVFTSNSTSITPKKYKKSIFAKFQKSQPKQINDEVLEYLNLDEIDWTENPFAWWAHNEKRFPYLSILARKYLPVPAASTASDSDVGNIMGPKRTRISPELFKRIIFLKRNSKMLPSIHPSTSK